MSSKKERFSRRDFLHVAGGAAMSLPMLASCAKATEEVTAPPESGEAGLVPGQRGGLWLPPEEPEMKKITVAVSTPDYYTGIHWNIINDWGFDAEEGFEEVDVFNSEAGLQGVVSKDITFAADLDADEVMVAVREGVPVFSVGTHRDHEWHIQGLSASIKKPEDLIGQKAVLGSPGTRSFAQRRAHVLEWSDGKVDIETDMEHIKLSGGSDVRQQALIADQIQIGGVFTRHLMGLKDAGCSWFVSGWFEIPQEAIVCHADTAREAPRTVINLLRAYLKSTTVTHNDEDKPEIQRVFAENHNLVLTPEFELAWHTQIEDFAPNGIFRGLAMRFFLEDLKKYDVIPQDLVYHEIYDVSFMRQAQFELYGYKWPAKEQSDFFTLSGLTTGM
ncbi:MAG: hypothetical protein A2Z14_04210 [Chloroflexi bacterium RBG_16_48_8]|nr:MAG: hypothetical protein A2Z14_04210 [Chloroflexi bacterium RBG_16_48_8]